MKHVMLDLETFGTKPGSVIISIGACAFDAHGDTIDKTCHLAIDAADSQRHGLRIDAGTVLWWMAPERDEARRRLATLPVIDLDSALLGFAGWLDQFGHDWLLWGHGANFDNALLQTAYEVCGIPVPWTYKQDRCFRTLKSLFPGHEPAFDGMAHDALADAVHQARWLQNIARSISDTVL
jgi:hypothetical protein